MATGHSLRLRGRGWQRKIKAIVC
ncbi:hypothetical protein CCACVL1_06620 [Corchorus capsularis]|uniref:Uncharacterized protein n=1 Tax=Corchorus capsularis TaxID=210143 RepID=A0A1R3JEB6_COCAP|nr:hypothetical protein CCACVL1_06620 [Corchorus capsularis]